MPHHRPVPEGVHPVAPEFTASPGSQSSASSPCRITMSTRRRWGFSTAFRRHAITRTVWLAHCYGMVGVGRDDPPESDGTEMYAVIGHAPGKSTATSRWSAACSRAWNCCPPCRAAAARWAFYVGAEKPVPILSVRIAADVPEAERTRIEVLRTESATFRAILDQRRNRREGWFKFNPAHIDLCNVPLPARAVPRPH
jgi:peptidylprolyl isomerase